MIAEWMRQMGAFAGREARRALRNTWLLVFSVLALLGGTLIFHFASPESTGFLFLQIQLFLLPLFAILIGCSSAHEDLEELPILFSQPVFRSAFLCGKWLALSAMLATVTALAMGSDVVFGRWEPPLFLLWIHGVALSGVFTALGLVLGVSWQDRARGLIASLLAWLALIFGCDALAWLAVQTRFAEQWPAAWVITLFANPTSVFRVGALLVLRDIPFHVPTTQPAAAWLLRHALILSPAVCTAWIVTTLALGSHRLHRGLDADGQLGRLFCKNQNEKRRKQSESRLMESRADTHCSQ